MTNNPKLGLYKPAPPPLRPQGRLTLDEQCPECLHPAWAHPRAGDRLWPACIGTNCTCLVLAR